jgi:hypothetical protein
MSSRPRGPIILRLVALFLVPLFAILFVFEPHGDGFVPALITYAVLLLGLGQFAAPALVDGAGVRVVIGLALAVGMFFLHLVVGVGGCTFVLAVHG